MFQQRASMGPRSQTTPSGNINGEWTHDLHKTVNTNSSLASRISNTPTGPRSQRNTRTRAANLNKMDLDSPQVAAQANVRVAPKGPGISIRGLAGPFVVMGQNFAPGTTAADVESAMTPIGGEMESCKVVKTQPFMVIEMVFASREGGERVIETFNDKTVSSAFCVIDEGKGLIEIQADGRLLKVYPKVGGNAPTGPRSERQKQPNDQVVDGSMGFPDTNSKSGLYSDKMVNTRSRGGQRGGQRGRNGK